MSSERVRLAALSVLGDSKSTKPGRLSALQELDKRDAEFLRVWVEVDNLDSELRLAALKLLDKFEAEVAADKAEADRQAAIEAARAADARASAERQEKRKQLSAEIQVIKAKYPSLDSLQGFLSSQPEPHSEAENVLLDYYQRKEEDRKRNLENAQLFSERFGEPKQLSPAERRAAQMKAALAQEAQRSLQAALRDGAIKEGRGNVVFVHPQDEYQEPMPRYDWYGSRVNLKPGEVWEDL